MTWNQKSQYCTVCTLVFFIMLCIPCFYCAPFSWLDGSNFDTVFQPFCASIRKFNKQNKIRMRLEWAGALCLFENTCSKGCVPLRIEIHWFVEFPAYQLNFNVGFDVFSCTFTLMLALFHACGVHTWDFPRLIEPPPPPPPTAQIVYVPGVVALLRLDFSYTPQRERAEARDGLFLRWSWKPV